MRIVVLGCGALGSLFAHHLSLAGASVCAVDLWSEHVEAIRSRGLRLQTADGEIIASSLRKATCYAAEAGLADVVVLFVKTHASRAALLSARSIIGPGTVIVTLQNGLGNAQLVRELYPRHTVLYGLTTLTADLLAPGLIAPRSTESGLTDVWTLDPADPRPARDFVALLKCGGVAARVMPDIDLSIWKKLVVNCALNGLCAVADLTCGELCAQPGIWPMLDGIVDEVAALAQARGVALDATQARAFLREVAQASSEHYPSMVFDVRHRRRTEIGSLNDAIVRAGQQIGLDTPINGTVVALVKAVEARSTSRP